MMAPVQLVWFKRDLRVFDHAPLAQAARRGPVLPLHIAEPGLWAPPDAAGRHWAFVAESLAELHIDLSALGQPLVVRLGEAVPVLQDLLDRLPIAALWSHEETGNGWTYARDRAVADLLRARGLPWHELPENGVVRRLPSRDGWSHLGNGAWGQPWSRRRWWYPWTLPWREMAPSAYPAVATWDCRRTPVRDASRVGGRRHRACWKASSLSGASVTTRKCRAR